MKKGSNDHRILALLEKWQTGDFNRFDEQELRRLLAEADPFMRDAAEGLLSHPEADHVARLDALRRRLSPPAAVLPERRPLWWAAAAALLALLAAWWWIDSPEPPAVAAVEKTLPSESLRTVPAAPDTPAAPPLLAAQQKRSRPAPGSPATAPSSVASRPSPTAADDTAADLSSISEVLQKATPPETASASEAASEAGVQPLADALPESPATPPPARAKTSEADQQAQTKPGAEALKKKKASAKPPSAPIPAGGWDRFRRDMRNQLTLPQAAKDKGVGVLTVTLILEIAPSTGQIRSVVFVQRAGYGCDEAAERFVHQYNWIAAPGGPNEVEVELIFR